MCYKNRVAQCNYISQKDLFFLFLLGIRNLFAQQMSQVYRMQTRDLAVELLLILFRYRLQLTDTRVDTSQTPTRVK